MGLSSRPSPDLLASPSGTSIAARVARAEHFFVDSLESWRIAVGVSSMILVGHSLGGYLSAAYTVRYPHRVSGLILLSPAGVPRGPGYDRSAAEGQKNEGDLEEATDAAELEINGNKTEDKQSIVRRSAMKGERDIIGEPGIEWKLTAVWGSLHLGLGARPISIHVFEECGSIRSTVGDQLHSKAVRNAKGGGYEGYS